MEQFTKAIRQALAQQNWQAALTIALTLPDVCGGLETPGAFNSKDRAIRWLNENRLHQYTMHTSAMVPHHPMPPVLKQRTDEETIRLYIEAILRRKEEKKQQQGVTYKTKIFFGGSDCYALRCALLHEGSTNTERQRAREALEDFQFVVHTGKVRCHGNLSKTVLQLDLEIFCNQMADAVDTWSIRVASNPGTQDEMARLLKITYL